MTREEFTKISWEKYSKWEASQKGQTSGYEYEKTFDKMLVEIGKDLLEKSTTGSDVSARKKKDKNAVWRC